MHVAEPPDPERMQGDPAKLPATPVALKVIVPAGAIGVPTEEVSVTVATQVDCSLIATGESHETVVDVVLALTVKVAVP